MITGIDELFRRLRLRAEHDPSNPIVRLFVRVRARNVCEYCLTKSHDTFHVDHIIPRARWRDYRDGKIVGLPPHPDRTHVNSISNFAWCCPACNGKKSSHVTFLLGNELVPLFDPRWDSWQDHFIFAHNYLYIIGRTDKGEATVQALGLNDGGIDQAVGRRHDNVLNGQYPPLWLVGHCLVMNE